VFEHPGGNAAGIEFCQVHFHDQLARVIVGACERSGQGAVLGFEQVHRLGQVHGVVRAMQGPYGALRAGVQAAEEAECEEPVPHESTQ